MWGDDVLGERFRVDLRAELRRQLVDLGVELVLGEGPPVSPDGGNPARMFTVTTNTGREITADIWFQCFGVTPESDYLGADLAGGAVPMGSWTSGPCCRLLGTTTCS